MRRRLALAVLLVAIVLGGVLWMRKTESSPPGALDSDEALQLPSTSTPAAVLPPAPSIPRPDPQGESPADAGEPEVVLLIRVPGAKPGERVQAWRQVSGNMNFFFCSLANEECSLTSLTPGTWSLCVVRTGLPLLLGPEAAQVSVTVEKGLNTATLKRAETSTVIVRVVDPSGIRVVGADLVDASDKPDKFDAFADPFADHKRALGKTGAGGEFSLALLLGETQTLVARAEGLRDSMPRVVRASDSSVVLALRRIPKVSGRVVRSDGTIVSRFSIDGRLFEASDGRFTLPVDVDSHQRRTFRASGLVPTTRTIEGSPENIELGDVVLDAARVLRGRVLDRLTGQPIGHAGVIGEGDTRAPCDDSGQFKLPEQPLRPSVLLAHAPAHASEQMTVPATENDVVIYLGKGVPVSGHLKDSSRMQHYVLAVGATVEVAKVDEKRNFRFDTLVPGRWAFVTTIHPIEGGLPLERMSDFAKGVVGDLEDAKQLDVGHEGVIDLHLE